MKVVIIEDEKSNSKRLISLLSKIDQEIQVLKVLESVEESIEYIANNPEPDLFFLDIQLADGLSFEIFEEIEINVPVIFTTAYDEYTLQAFKLNSIDYLLKPIDPIELERSIIKYKKLFSKDNVTNSSQIEKLLTQLQIEKPKFRSRILLKNGRTMTSQLIEEIAFFVIDNQLLYVYNFQGEKFILDNNLEDLEKQINPELFFRVNRQTIININIITKMVNYEGGRLRLVTNPGYHKEIIVSREKVGSFKNWINQ